LPPDEDEILYARRMIAQRCLYGVDRNPMAVDLAKLSLWLATLAKDHPFTFLDHSLRAGDSLVGLSKKQIAAFHWAPPDAKAKKDGFSFGDPISDAIRRATDFRQRILAARDEVPYEHLRQQLDAADEALDKARFVGDLVVAAYFSAEKDKAREERVRELALRLVKYLGPGGKMEDRQPLADAVRQLRSGDRPVTPFHWEIEFPEVFGQENPGFDAIVGNPPFAGKNTLINGNRAGYLDWLKQIHEESHGNADVVAHFFRRALNLLRYDGCFGLIATKTIGQGDTRATGLRWICLHEATIYAARNRLKWPGAAAVTISIVHVRKGSEGRAATIDGRQVPSITSYLFHTGGNDDAVPLHGNEGRCYIGSFIHGAGFTFDDSDTSGEAHAVAVMERLITNDSQNSERIFPYIGGEEVNDSPSHKHHRYVINFADMPLQRCELCKSWHNGTEKERSAWVRSGKVPADYPNAVAADWPDLLRLVEEKVKPERAKLGDTGDAKRRKEHWWLWGRYTPGLFGAISALDRVLVTCLVTQHLSFTFLNTGFVFSKNLAVFPLDTFASFSTLQSSIHEVWARFFSSTLEDRLNYSPSDCFVTFPPPDGSETIPTLERAGREYYEFRAALMVRNNEGLTKTYNRFHDPNETSPDILKLRELHAAMDRTVLDAYGWTDMKPTCEFLLDYEEEDEDENGGEPSGGRGKKKPWRYRWPDEFRDEVLARLLELNKKRAEEEAVTGVAAQGTGKAAAASPTKKAAAKKSSRARKDSDDRPLFT